MNKKELSALIESLRTVFPDVALVAAGQPADSASFSMPVVVEGEACALAITKSGQDSKYPDVSKYQAISLVEVLCENVCPGGSDVLSAVSDLIRSCIRSTDDVLPLGGNMLLVAFPQIPEETFAAKMRDISLNIESLYFPDAPQLAVSANIGCAYRYEAPLTIEAAQHQLELARLGKPSPAINFLPQVRTANIFEDLSASHPNDSALSVIAAIGSDYDYIGSMDRRTGRSRTYYSTDLFRSYFPQGSAETSIGNYSSGGEAMSIIKKLVLAEDYERFCQATTEEAICSALAEKPAYYVDYRVMLADGISFYQNKYVQDKNSPNIIIFAVRSIDEQTRAELRRREQEQMEITIMERTAELQERNRALNRINDDIIELVGTLTEARDLDSGEHIRRVKGFAHILAEQVMAEWPEYGLTKELVELITSASALHDVGKIMIPDAILLKPGRLTKEEFEVMKQHSMHGCEIIDMSPKDWSEEYRAVGRDICRWHHEKWDGKGYPDGLKGDEIPISAQIVSVADCFDALVTKRVYKDAYTPEQAYAMIRGGECGAFSPRLMSSFEKVKDAFFTHATDKESMYVSAMPAGLSVEYLADLRVLLVEDNDLSREIGKEILEGEGASVTEACDGKEALDLFMAHPSAYDAILMDNQMPVMSGPEAARAIRVMGVPEAETVPIIALTSSSDREDIRACFEAGMDAYLTKPVTIANMTKALLECLHDRNEKFRERMNLALRYANKDPLTGVKNLTAYTEMISRLSSALSGEDAPQFAFVNCGINNLEQVITACGREAGDLYIRNCCRIICNVFKHSPVYRIGSDEFIVLLQNGDYDNRTELFAALHEEVVSASVLPEIQLGKASFAVGWSLYDPAGDSTPGDVLQRANAEMVENKRLMKFSENILDA